MLNILNPDIRIAHWKNKEFGNYLTLCVNLEVYLFLLLNFATVFTKQERKQEPEIIIFLH